MRFFTKTHTLFCLGLFSGCQTLSPGAGPTALPTPQYSATLSFSPSPSPMPTPTALPTPWTPPPLLDTCREDLSLAEPHDVAITRDGSRLFFSTLDARLYELVNSQAKQIKNKEGKCLFGRAEQIEIDSKGNLFVAASWRFEQVYFGSQVYFVKPDLSEIKVVSEYNAKYIPKPQGTPPVGTYHEGIADLFVSTENKGFLMWGKHRTELTDNDYMVIPFSEELQIATPYLLARGLNKITPITYEDKSRKLYFFMEEGDSTNFNLPNSAVIPTPFSSKNKFSFIFDSRLEPKTGELIVNDWDRIIKFNPHTQQIISIAGQAREHAFMDGAGDKARFNQIKALDIDAAGNIYVADSGNRAIRKITPEGMVSTLYRAPTPSASP